MTATKTTIMLCNLLFLALLLLVQAGSSAVLERDNDDTARVRLNCSSTMQDLGQHDSQLSADAANNWQRIDNDCCWDLHRGSSEGARARPIVGSACVDTDNDVLVLTLHATGSDSWICEAHVWTRNIHGSSSSTTWQPPKRHAVTFYASTSRCKEGDRPHQLLLTLNVTDVWHEYCNNEKPYQRDDDSVFVELLVQVTIMGADETTVVASAAAVDLEESAAVIRVLCDQNRGKSTQPKEERVLFGNVEEEEENEESMPMSFLYPDDSSPGEKALKRAIASRITVARAKVAMNVPSPFANADVSTQSLTNAPSSQPSMFPIMTPTKYPTRSPTVIPVNLTTRSPTKTPTMAPTKYPTRAPTKSPTMMPTRAPTRSPTRMPTRRPTRVPTRRPTRRPTRSPTRPPTWVNCGPSVRRAWHDTSCEDRAAYLRAVELLYKLPATNSLNIPNYFDFVRLHYNSNNSLAAHGANDGPFLPWHRWYLWTFEKALQYVSGTCVTVPYWDWTRDKGNEYNSTVLQPDSFGSTTTGINRTDGCVIEGIASKNGFWKTTVRSGGCLRRAFTARYANFSSEIDIVRLIVNFPSFGRGLSGFSNNLQGTPHAVVHNFVGQHMISYYSPDDPLFMLHHCNVDRIWALYQDYWNHDLKDKLALTDEEYQAGRGIGRDDPLPFTSSAGRYPRFFWTAAGRSPTPREVHHSFGELVKVTYANDYLGLLLTTMNSSYVAANNQSWIEIASGPVSAISCSRRLVEEEGSASILITEVNEVLGIPDEVPPFSNVAARIMYNNVTSEGLSPQDAINSLAYRQCEEHGNMLMASQDWIDMHGMSKDLFRCFNRGEPSDCNPNIDIVLSHSDFPLERNPVHVLSYGRTSVSFVLSQVWRAGHVEMVAVHYVDVDGIERCDTVNDVFTGEFGSYEAHCDDGLAALMFYMNDPSVSTLMPAAWATELCDTAGLPLAGTVAYSVTIPCILYGAQCPMPSASDPLCDGTPNYLVATETFKSLKSASSWVFSTTGRDVEHGAFLKPKRGTSKTYSVPSNANSLTVTLEVYELDCAMATDFVFNVGHAAVSLGRVDCTEPDSRSFTSGNIVVEVSSKADSVDKVSLGIPPEYYQSDGRLTIGLTHSAIGIGSLTITADCTNQWPFWKNPKVTKIIERVVVP